MFPTQDICSVNCRTQRSLFLLVIFSQSLGNLAKKSACTDMPWTLPLAVHQRTRLLRACCKNFCCRSQRLMYWKLIPEAPQLVLTPMIEQKTRGDFLHNWVPIHSILNSTWMLPVWNRAQAQRMAFWMSCCPLVARKACKNDSLGATEEIPVTERAGVGKGYWLAFKISTTTNVKLFCLLVLEIKMGDAS